LNHPNIATIHAIEESDDETFIVMEYVEGNELKQRIAQGPLPVEETINIATQIAEGLHAAHKKEIVHRDIKSANIMLTESGQVKIMDFGLAKEAEECSSKKSRRKAQLRTPASKLVMLSSRREKRL
jgi:serine/threonine protein kinase